MSLQPNRGERIAVRPWSRATAPSTFLIIRMHATGDVAITFPACASLRKRFPHARIDFLTSTGLTPLAESLDLFDAVHNFRPSSSKWKRLQEVVRVASRLRREKYDVVLDLQRNWVSRLLRRGLAPAAWAEFDRFSSRPAGSRTLETFHSAGFRETELCFRLPVRIDLIESAARVLQQNGWNGSVPVVVLNPAGLWTTRNWPLENYIEFARLWIRHQDAMFLFLGTERIQREAGVLSSSLGRNAINLVGRTSLRDVLPLLQHVSFVLSEDSGLMHMAWTSGIPTLALFGSSRHDWSAPMGPHARCLHSGDLPCGACMSPTCAFGDVHCLTRHTADAVFRAAQSVMQPTRMFRS